MFNFFKNSVLRFKLLFCQPLFPSIHFPSALPFSLSLCLILVLVLPSSRKERKRRKEPFPLKIPPRDTPKYTGSHKRSKYYSFLLSLSPNFSFLFSQLLFPPLSPNYSFLLLSLPVTPHSHIAPVTNRKVCVPSVVPFFSNQDWLTDGLIFKGLIYGGALYHIPITPSTLKDICTTFPILQFLEDGSFSNLPTFPILQFLEDGRWALNGTDNDPIVNLNSL